MAHLVPFNPPTLDRQVEQPPDSNGRTVQNLSDLGLLVESKAAHRHPRDPALSHSRSRPKARPNKSWSGKDSSTTRPNLRSKRGLTGMLDIERSHTRRDRTFAGSACACCEEPLEHTLRGEKILQLSCAHVVHEACFYEYIREFESSNCPTCDAPLGLDSSRGGNVLDVDKLSQIVRSLQQSAQPQLQYQHARNTSGSNYTYPGSNSTYPPEQPLERVELEGDRGAPTQFERKDSASSHPRQDNGRRHDYDFHSMETTLTRTRISSIKNPIPPPTVLVRSEFPTITRSKQQQSLTCLVTIEVAEGKWHPRAEDVRSPPGLPGSSDTGTSRPEQFDSPEDLETIAADLHSRVDNWHGLDFARFGKLRLHGRLKVGKDRQSWQELECFLFEEMLICVKEKKNMKTSSWDGKAKCKWTLKGSIMIKKHLKQIEHSDDDLVLTLNLSVAELPAFHLHFDTLSQLQFWRHSLSELSTPAGGRKKTLSDQDNSGTDDEGSKTTTGAKSISSWGGQMSAITAPTEYSSAHITEYNRMAQSLHVPIDIVVVVPVSSSMHGLKITLLQDALHFLVQNLGERDRMGLVTFGSNGGTVPLVNMTTKVWSGWPNTIRSIKAVGQRSVRGDMVEGANAAMDLLMQRKYTNSLSSILLISDSSTADAESIDFVVSRAEAAKVSINSFGLGLTHKPDTMIELSTRTKASYSYVKDWMMLRECVAGCLGSLQTTSHQNAKLRLRLPDGSPAKFVKVSGALQVTKRATGRDAEAALGDLRFGDKRDILVQLAIDLDDSQSQEVPQDAWESLVSGLEALGGSMDHDESRISSVEELPIIQADLSYGDLLRDGTVTHLPRPSLLTITILPANPAAKPKSPSRPSTPAIPPHPSVVQRRMELLTSDMLTRALTLVSRGQHDRAHHLLRETRSILKGLGKGSLPPLPANLKSPSSPTSAAGAASALGAAVLSSPPSPSDRTNTSGSLHDSLSAASNGIDPQTMVVLDKELESSLEWIIHPAVFGRDSRKAVLQAIGVIGSQRAFTFRTPLESLWAGRIAGVQLLAERARDWREEVDEGSLLEEQ